MCLNYKKVNKQLNQREANENKHGNIQQLKVNKKETNQIRRVLSLLMLLLQRAKIQNKKRPKWDGKVESLKEKKITNWWQLPLTLCIHTIYYYYYKKKIKYLHYIHSVSTFITVRYASYYICCCNYLRVPSTVDRHAQVSCRTISLYNFFPKIFPLFLSLSLFLNQKKIQKEIEPNPILSAGTFSYILIF